LQKLADDLIQPASFDEVAAAKVPNEPFTCAKLGGHHGTASLSRGQTEPTAPKNAVAQVLPLMQAWDKNGGLSNQRSGADPNEFTTKGTNAAKNGN
jgi:hypothetical protein